jgi:CRP-like cAMP-binding protein
VAPSTHLAEEIALLDTLPVFEGFGREALQIVAFSCDIRLARAGETLFREGAISDCGYVVLSGAVTLETAAGETAIHGRGALIGAQALIAPVTRPATARMREEGQIMRIPRTLMRRVLEAFPENAERLAARVGSEAEATLEAAKRALDALAPREG